MRTVIRYYPGGWKPDHPSENVAYRLDDNEDGTGTEYAYDAAGTLVSSVERTDLPLPEPDPPPTAEERIAALEADLAAALALLNGGV
jgi:hypothetical protein